MGNKFVRQRPGALIMQRVKWMKNSDFKSTVIRKEINFVSVAAVLEKHTLIQDSNVHLTNGYDTFPVHFYCFSNSILTLLNTKKTF